MCVQNVAVMLTFKYCLIVITIVCIVLRWLLGYPIRNFNVIVTCVWAIMLSNSSKYAYVFIQHTLPSSLYQLNTVYNTFLHIPVLVRHCKCCFSFKHVVPKCLGKFDKKSETSASEFFFIGICFFYILQFPRRSDVL